MSLTKIGHDNFGAEVETRKINVPSVNLPGLMIGVVTTTLNGLQIITGITAVSDYAAIPIDVAVE